MTRYFLRVLEGDKIICEKVSSEGESFVGLSELESVCKELTSSKYRVAVDVGKTTLSNDNYKIIVCDERILDRPNFAFLKDSICAKDTAREFVDKTVIPKVHKPNRVKSNRVASRNKGVVVLLGGIVVVAMVAGSIATAITQNEKRDFVTMDEFSSTYTREVSDMLRQANISDNIGYIEYESQVETEESIKKREQYLNMMEYCADIYGLDSELLMGIACAQDEVDINSKDKDDKVGLMQLPESLIGKTLSYFIKDSETGKFVPVSIQVTSDMLRDTNWSIHLACIMHQGYLRYYNYNVPLAVQACSQGNQGLDEILIAYASVSGKEYGEVVSNQSDLGWMDYRGMKGGDPKFLESVLSYANSQSFKVVNVEDGKEVPFKVINGLDLAPSIQ